MSEKSLFFRKWGKISKPIFVLLCALLLLSFSVLEQSAYSENLYNYREISPEFDALKAKVVDFCSLSVSKQKQEEFFQFLLIMEEEGFVKLLTAFVAEKRICNCLLDIRKSNPYISFNDWGDWNNQALTYTLPPGAGWSAPGPTEMSAIIPVRNPVNSSAAALGSGASLPGSNVPVFK